MSDSVLDRIRQNRHRAAVPPRDDTLVVKPQLLESVSEETPIPAPDPQAANPSDAIAELKAELAQIPQTNRHSASVLDKELDQNLTRHCKDQRITVETFLEAAWIYADANPEAMAEILTEAKRRYAERKRAGKLRRLITMLESQA